MRHLRPWKKIYEVNLRLEAVNSRIVGLQWLNAWMEIQRLSCEKWQQVPYHQSVQTLERRVHRRIHKGLVVFIFPRHLNWQHSHFIQSEQGQTFPLQIARWCARNLQGKKVRSHFRLRRTLYQISIQWGGAVPLWCVWECVLNRGGRRRQKSADWL